MVSKGEEEPRRSMELKSYGAEMLSTEWQRKGIAEIGVEMAWRRLARLRNVADKHGKIR